MNRKFFVLLTEEFCLQHQEYRQGANIFNYAVTLDGRFVAAVNTLVTFAEIFPIDYIPEVIAVTTEEFPTENAESDE